MLLTHFSSTRSPCCRPVIPRIGGLIVGTVGAYSENGTAMRSHKAHREGQLTRRRSLDVLALDGEDLRKLPLHLRTTNLARRPEGIFVSEFEQGEIGPDLFRQACKFGLEGLVSKRRDRPYRAGRSPDWIKVKNRSHPAMERVKENW